MFRVSNRMKRCGRPWALVLAGLVATASVSAETLPLDPMASSLTFVGSAFLHDFRGEAKEISGNAELDAVGPKVKTKYRLSFVLQRTELQK